MVAPSILAADFADLAAAITGVEDAGVTGLHLDVMDGHFVPNITFGPALVAAVAGRTDAFLDCHLMIEEPLRYAGAFADAGADLISIHAELFEDPRPALEAVSALGVRVGIAINPDTPLERVAGCLDACDLLVVMSVFPGFGGQSFRPESVPKIAEAAALRAREGLGFAIEVDGGIGVDNARLVADAGADVLVAGSAVFGAPDPTAAVVAIAGAGAGVTG